MLELEKERNELHATIAALTEIVEKHEVLSRLVSDELADSIRRVIAACASAAERAGAAAYRLTTRPRRDHRPGGRRPVDAFAPGRVGGTRLAQVDHHRGVTIVGIARLGARTDPTATARRSDLMTANDRTAASATTEQGRRPIRRALVSVYDKTGLEDLVRGLHDAGVELVSTGGS